jgi:2-C-methyl-D-erythritol 4-phosphate cytidylyltransferase
MKVTAVVPAAGSGLRMSNVKKGGRKPFFIVKGKPILIRTLQALERSGEIDDIILVVHKNDVTRCREAVRTSGLRTIRAVIPGGRTRFQSVKKGLSLVDTSSDIVLIHDGVRPLVEKRVIRDTIRACARFGAAVCGVPVASTIKKADRRQNVKATPDRRGLYEIQTPQAFRRSTISKAYGIPVRDPSRVTDDSMMVERLGRKIKIVDGSFRNIKVTTPLDLAVLAAFLGEAER